MAEFDARIGGTLNGKWRLDALIGRGGMASVYAATHRNAKRVAIKILAAELSAIPEVRERFLREGYVANTVGHRGAVSVDDEGVTEDGAAFLVMELLEGETLEARRERAPGGRLPAQEVAAYADQVLDTLAAAHGKGIVHRDLKPENIFLTTEGIVKVLDFGIARLRDGTSTKSSTASGTLLGTPAYLPPEQARGEWKDVDGRTDLWAMGASMFALLAGRCVHEGDNVNLLLLAAMTKEAPELRSVAPNVPAELGAIVDRALLRAKDARWPDAGAMQTALRNFLEGAAGRTGSSGNWSRASSAGATAPVLASATGPELETAAARSQPSPSVAVSSTATVVPITTRTFRTAAQARSRSSAATGAAAVGGLGLVGAIVAFAISPPRGAPALPTAAEVSAHVPSLGASGRAIPSASPSVEPAGTATAATPKALSISDLPDVEAPTAPIRARPSSSSAAKTLKAPMPAPTAQPTPKAADDPFSARR